ncbi:Ger(x)C family spore germination protein [Paenibacillus sp. PK3_47]|uniref:Ger(x)C family spore germination protein n=1 Tax=Paenibacillus sp. PK3_47 TaxID=2072642 RepID=UPI00201D3C97|nr:Ger(x)C family spore germination protein [Paenibacillus sp. PK3_47]UQZ36788.1 Ger(x)C family spore germination protein [Paenibacillus sp. PK3_47]
MRLFRAFFIPSILFLFLTGCGNRIELNELGITTATGYDGHKGDWTISYQVIVPSAMTAGSGSAGSGGSQSAIHTFSTKGRSIREAVAASSIEHPRKLYFAHTNVVIIGKEAAEAGIGEILDNYYRNPDARETVKVFVTDGKASDCLKVLIPPEKLPGQALANILQRNAQLSSYYPSMSVHQLALQISSDSAAAGVPELSIEGLGDTLESIDIYKETAPAGTKKLSRLAVFYKDKQVGTLSRNESLGLNWLNDRVQSTTLSSENSKGEITAFLVRKAKVKITPIKGPEHYTLRVNVKVNAEITETTSDEDITTAQGLKVLQREAEERIEAQILEGWNGMQKLNLDLAGIGNNIHRKHPGDWKEIKGSWPEALAEMDIDISVKVNLIQPGLLQASFNKLLGEQ